MATMRLARFWPITWRSRYATISRGVGSRFSAARGDVFIAPEHRTPAQTPPKCGSKWADSLGTVLPLPRARQNLEGLQGRVWPGLFGELHDLVRAGISPI